MLPNPDKLRQRLARTGHVIPIGEYLLMNALVAGVSLHHPFHFVGWSKIVNILVSFMLGLGLPHMIIGRMGNKRH